MRNCGAALLMVLVLICVSCGGEAGGEGQAKNGETEPGVSCLGETYSSCICPGHKVCPVDGEYDFVNVQCDNPVEVTAQNIDNIVGSLRLKDPPCKDSRNCRRVGVHDSFAAPANDPNCRCREKIAMCKPRI
ncbi:MAG TPA: hypothetical protein VFX02_12095 [Gammaproteobacteria bacterium]|nr:hypothetical protein [Gammaproteobacteria bacterium]